jgi:hypothetical protein
MRFSLKCVPKASTTYLLVVQKTRSTLQSPYFSTIGSVLTMGNVIFVEADLKKYAHWFLRGTYVANSRVWVYIARLNQK